MTKDRKCLALIFLVLCSTFVYGQNTTMAFPSKPQQVKNSSGSWLVYDLHIASNEKFCPTEIKVFYENTLIYSSKNFQLFAKDSSAYVHYAWIKLKTTKINKIKNLVTYTQDDKILELSQSIPVTTSKPLEIAWPLPSGKWLAANAPDITSEHTNTTIKTGNKVYDSIQKGWILGHNSQRFAIDFVGMSDKGTLFAGDGTANKDWFCYGSKIKSVADGVVINVIDSINDNKTPGKIDYKITKNNIGGNSVFVDLGNGKIAFYGHMQKNSILVKKGDKIKMGHPIGLLGNSGQSTAPHLHFHIIFKDPSILFADSFNGLLYEGAVYRFNTFKSYGKAKEDFWSESEDGRQIITPFSFGVAKEYSKSLPVNFEVIEIK
jgi:hypothetical protein